MSQKPSRSVRPSTWIFTCLCTILIALATINPLPIIHAQFDQPAVLPVFCVSQDGTGSPDCEAIFLTIQEAVDAAEPFTEIRVAAGVYQETFSRNGTVQSAYIDKSVFIQGGYAPDNWHDPDPVANPTIVDPQQKGRAFYIVGNSDGTEGLFVSISGLEIINGTALTARADQRDGGAVRVLAADLTLQDNVLKENRATNGGALSAHSSVLHLFRNKFLQNSARDSAISAGGALFLHLSGMEMSGNLFQGNSATGTEISGGGAIAADICLVSMENDNVVRGNRAEGAKVALGGGLLFANCDAYVLNATIDDNLASSTTASQGGGLYLYSSVPLPGSSIIGQNDISNNSAVASDGAAQGAGLLLNQSGSKDEPIYLIANAISRNRVVSQNVADIPHDNVEEESGAAGGGLHAALSVVVLGQNHVEGNEVSAIETEYAIGGGLSLYYSAAYLESNRLMNNLVASGHAAGGGGIATQFSAVALANTIINSNFADGASLDGGTGMYALDSLLEAANTVVQYNGGGAFGAGLLLDGHENLGMHFRHSTITENLGDDGTGIALWQGELLLTNSLIAKQLAGVEAHNESKIALNGVLWHENKADAVGTGIIAISHSYRGDPLFVDDFHIDKESAAIDRGLPSGIERDIDNEPRGEVPDLGADEYVEVLPPPEPTAPPTAPVPPPAPTMISAAQGRALTQPSITLELPDPSKIPALLNITDPERNTRQLFTGIGRIDKLLN